MSSEYQQPSPEQRETRASPFLGHELDLPPPRLGRAAMTIVYLEPYDAETAKAKQRNARERFVEAAVSDITDPKVRAHAAEAVAASFDAHFRGRP